MLRHRRLIAILLGMALIGLGGCAGNATLTETKSEEAQVEKAPTALAHRYASKEEGTQLLLDNSDYYNGFSQNDLDFRMQKQGATMTEYQDFAKEQVQEFTDEEKEALDGVLSKMATSLDEHNYHLPMMEEIVFVKTTMEEELGAGAYTHKNQIYLSGDLIESLSADADEEKSTIMTRLLWHEIFHCLTRSNPEYRAEMYKLIGFTVADKDFAIPASVFEYHISNPDVEHHDSYATFRIDGKDVECFCDFVTTKHFDTPGETFFDCEETALVPIDGSDTYYKREQAENFDEVFGKNTDYVNDPEECLADNFAYALTYGMNGEDGKGYPNPEIVESMLVQLSI